MKRKKPQRRDTRCDPRPQRRSARRVATGEVQKRKLTRDPDAPARAAAYKRRAPRGRARGNGECIDAARKEIGSRTVECPRCGLLVDWRQAKSAATRARRELRPGDGCKGQQCGKRRRVRAPERARAQVKSEDGGRAAERSENAGRMAGGQQRLACVGAAGRGRARHRVEDQSDVCDVKSGRVAHACRR